MKNKKIIFGFIIAFFISLNVYNIPFKEKEIQATQLNKQNVTEKKIDISKLNEAINLSLKTPINILDYEHLIVSFWATWCPSCHRENQIFNQYSKKYKNTMILGVCVDKDKTALNSYVKKNPLNFKVINTSKSVALLFDDIMAVPTHFFINVKNGSITKTMGLLDENQINNLLRKKQ